MREGWKDKKLIEVCRLVNGRAYKKPELLSEGTYPVLRVGNLFTNNQWYYSDLELDEDKYCNSGDLIYAWSASFGPRIWEGEKVIYHYHIWKVIPDFNQITKDFLYHLFEWDKEQIKSAHGTGTTMMHVGKNSMENRIVPIPPISEQKEIVAILDKAFESIDKAKTNIEKNIENAKELFQSKLNEIFSQKGDGWEEKSFGEVCEISGGSQPSKDNFIYEPKEGYIRLIQVRDYRTDKYKTYIPLEKAKKFCTENDIMIGRYGPPIFGIFSGIEGAYNVALMKAIPNEDKLNKDFFRWFLKTPELVKYVEITSKRAAGQDGVRKERLYSYPTPIPPVTEQKEIASTLDKLNNFNKTCISTYKKEIENLEELKKSILQKAFNGELTAKDIAA